LCSPVNQYTCFGTGKRFYPLEGFNMKLKGKFLVEKLITNWKEPEKCHKKKEERAKTEEEQLQDHRLD
jgi:hypothetical protein